MLIVYLHHEQSDAGDEHDHCGKHHNATSNARAALSLHDVFVVGNQALTPTPLLDPPSNG
jgi:hypothetical protein